MADKLTYFERMGWGSYWVVRLCRSRVTRVTLLRTTDQLLPDLNSVEKAERMVLSSPARLSLFEPFDRYVQGPWREMSFEANRLALKFLDHYVAVQPPHKLLTFLTTVLGPAGGEKYLKKCLHPYVALKILFFKQVAYLEKTGMSPDVVVPKDRDPLKIGDWLGCANPMRRCPWILRQILTIQEWLNQLVGLASVVGIFMLHAARVRLRVIPSSADLTVPVVHGFPGSGAWLDDRKPNSGDDAFQRESWSQGLTYLYLFTTWQIPRAFKQRWQEYIEGQPRASLRDARTFRHDAKVFLTAFCPFLLRAASTIARVSSASERLVAAALVPKLTYVYGREFLMATNVSTKIYLTRDDYAATHIVRTAILNKSGTRTLALMHSALVPAQYWATLCYVNCDAYLIHSNAYRSLYAPYWESADGVIPIGNWKTDLIKRCQADEGVRGRFRAKYGDGFFILALVQEENPSAFRTERLRELYAGILQALEIGDDLKVILRPRRNGFNDVPELQKAQEQGRVVVELLDFNTHELQAMCDMVIAGTASSSGLVEALSTGKAGVGFNIHGWGETVLGGYSSRLIAETKDDLVRFVSHVYRREDGYAEIQRAVESFRLDYCKLDDGHVLQRMGRLIRSWCGQAQDHGPHTALQPPTNARTPPTKLSGACSESFNRTCSDL